MDIELKNYYSSDIDDLENYIPQDPYNFGFHLGLFIGEIKSSSEDYFQLYVCTPQNIQYCFERDGITGDFLRHHLIVVEYNFNEILKIIKEYLANINEDTWDAVVKKIERIAKSEYEDYIP